MAHVVPGFRFSAVSAGIRRDGRIDVALAAADAPVSVAGLFTRNLVRAAPVLVAEERVCAGSARAILVNSGCANACTGEPGLAATLESTAAVARALGVEPAAVLPASTGAIGAVLPAKGIVERAGELARALSPQGSDDFATAILTTDRWPKTAHVELGSARGPVQVLAIGKGAGMIHPDVGPPQATALVFAFTDARASSAELALALTEASDATFNATSVDGDTSTNDSVFALASGVSDAVVPVAELARAFSEVFEVIARSMVADGEGATHAVELRVSGVENDAGARRIAATVATSLLVKTALFGQDANWGRLLAAAGRAGVRFDPGVALIRIGGIAVAERGLPVGAQAEAEAGVAMRAPSYVVELVLGNGPGRARYFTSDLGHGYVDVNASYRS